MKIVKNCYQNQIKTGRSIRLKSNEIHNILFNVFDVNKLIELKSSKFNSNFYENGLFLTDCEFFYRIEKILTYESEYYFLCIQYSAVFFDELKY